MDILGDLRRAVGGALSDGADAARTQGAALKSDFENLVRPQLDDILKQTAAITDDFLAGDIGKEQAQEDLLTQSNRIKPLILAVSELALLAVQVIIDAVLNALKSAVNTAAGAILL